MLSSSFKAKRSRFQAGQSLFQAGRAVSILGRLVSISSSLENNESGAKHSAKANSCLRPQSKVKAMPREAISEKKKRLKRIDILNGVLLGHQKSKYFR